MGRCHESGDSEQAGKETRTNIENFRPQRLSSNRLRRRGQLWDFVTVLDHLWELCVIFTDLLGVS
jgi:hypothetical protein